MKKILIVLALSFLKISFSQNIGLDTSFGNNGRTIISSKPEPTNVFYENGKYIFIYYNGASSVNYDGTIDTTFGNNGNIVFNSNNLNENYFVVGSKIFNGYIYVYGQKYTGSSENKNGFVIKLTLSGDYDLSFGDNGKAAYDFGENEEIINDLNINSSNQIYVVGTRNNRIFLSKINPNGTIDTTFDTNGFKVYSLNEYENSKGVNLFFQLDEILVVGSSTYPTNVTNSIKYLILLKVDENGNLSSSFGVNGIKEVAIGSSLCGISVIKSLLKNNNELYFERYESCSFYTQINQLYKYNISENLLSSLNSLKLYYTKFEITSDNNIFTTGAFRCTFTPCNESYFINKKNSDGTPDLSFNITGAYSYRFGPVSDDYSSAFYIHEDGKILLAGYTTNNGNYGVQNTPGLGIIRLTNLPLNTMDFDENSLFEIVPNPVKNKISIINPNNVKVDNFEIFDISGRPVHFTNNANDEINIENIQKGVYFLKINSEGKIVFKKFIKD